VILTDRQIREAYVGGDIIIDPFEEKQLQPATYDFRVGENGATTSAKKIINIRETGYLLLVPGDFAVITVFEKLRLNNQYVGRFGLRSKYTRKGLIATTGPQIDPGYDGRLILGLTNLTPKSMAIPYKDDLISVEFHRLEEPSSKPYTGPYQHKYELGPEDIEMVVETEGMALSEVLNTLRTLTQNVAALSNEVKWLKWIFPIAAAVIAILVAIPILR
jgi:dCTP deaminase